MRDLTQAQVSHLYNHLIGSPEDIDAALQELFEIESITDLSEDTLFEIDEMMFQCAACGWWCEASEAVEGPLDEDVCQDCGEGDDEGD